MGPYRESREEAAPRERLVFWHTKAALLFGAACFVTVAAAAHGYELWCTYAYGQEPVLRCEYEAEINGEIKVVAVKAHARTTLVGRLSTPEQAAKAKATLCPVGAIP